MSSPGGRGVAATRMSNSRTYFPLVETRPLSRVIKIDPAFKPYIGIFNSKISQSARIHHLPNGRKIICPPDLRENAIFRGHYWQSCRRRIAFQL